MRHIHTHAAPQIGDDGCHCQGSNKTEKNVTFSLFTTVFEIESNVGGVEHHLQTICSYVYRFVATFIHLHTNKHRSQHTMQYLFILVHVYAYIYAPIYIKNYIIFVNLHSASGELSSNNLLLLCN